jgi:hypothetical protein
MNGLQKILEKYLEANQTLAEHNLSHEEIQDIAAYLRK